MKIMDVVKKAWGIKFGKWTTILLVGVFLVSRLGLEVLDDLPEPLPWIITATILAIVIMIAFDVQEKVVDLVNKNREGSFDGFEKARDDITQTIISEYKRRKNKVIRIEAIGVSLVYTCNWLRSQLRELLKDNKDMKIQIEACMVSTEYLNKMVETGAMHWAEPNDWCAEAEISYKYLKDLESSAEPDLGGLTVKGVHLYEFIPQWHGLLINNNYLYLGRCEWDWEMVGEGAEIPPRLSIGQCLYRYYFADDKFGGRARVELFKGWFKYLKRVAIRPSGYGIDKKPLGIGPAGIEAKASLESIDT